MRTDSTVRVAKGRAGMTNKLVCSKCLEPVGVLFNKDESEALSAAYQSGVQEFRSRYQTLVEGVKAVGE